MLDKQNIIVDHVGAPVGNKGIVFQVAHEIYLKMVDYLRLTQAKNTFNRLSDYHYLNIAVSNSTEPIRGIDYIHPVVTPGVDYATAIITKCLMPNGKVNFEFERFSEKDSKQSAQATEMVKYMINSKNDSYQIIRDWAQPRPWVQGARKPLRHPSLESVFVSCCIGGRTIEVNMLE